MPDSLFNNKTEIAAKEIIYQCFYSQKLIWNHMIIHLMSFILGQSDRKESQNKYSHATQKQRQGPKNVNV